MRNMLFFLRTWRRRLHLWSVSSLEERYCHQMIVRTAPDARVCPRIPGIDGHRFTRRHGFVATFCDLQKGLRAVA